MVDSQFLALIEAREEELADGVRLCERRLRQMVEIDVVDGRLCGLALVEVGRLRTLQTAKVIEAAHQLARAQSAYLAVKLLHDDALRALRRIEARS